MKNINNIKSKKMIKSILICTENEFTASRLNQDENHNPKKINNKTYIGAGKERNSLFRAMDELNNNYNGYILAPGDCKTCNIEKDITSDLGGYMNPKKGTFSDNRMSLIKTSMAIAKDRSSYIEDLWTRMKNNLSNEDKDEQRINTNIYSGASHPDVISINLLLDAENISVHKYPKFDNDGNFTNILKYKSVDDTETKRSCELFLKASKMMNSYFACQSIAAQQPPKKIFICFSPVSEYNKYFEMSDMERSNFEREIQNIGGHIIIGDNNTNYSVNDAINDAIVYLNSNELMNSDLEIKSQSDAIRETGYDKSIIETNEVKKENKKASKNKTSKNTEMSKEYFDSAVKNN